MSHSFENSLVSFLRPPRNLASRLLVSSPKAIDRGFKKGHLGTARLWSNVFRTRKESILLHIDADTIFLGECIESLIEAIMSGADAAGTRRPYYFRKYRKTGKDGRLLDKHPDVLNTDLIALRRRALPNPFSPLLTRSIRGRRPLKYPVVDFFDPILLKMISMGKKVDYLDSPESGISSVPNFNSQIYTNRISFAAVGSGLNFIKNPNVKTSPGYRSYAISSFALYSKYILEEDLEINTLENEEIENRLKLLDKKTWTLRTAS